QALYTQFDYKFFERLSASLGMRWERYTLDRSDKDAKPVFRAGINYQAADLTFVRASFGQGYRYPSMAEKYTSTGLGGLKIFPNYVLQPETGWSAEIGLKQGFLAGGWRGYADVAAFWTEYDDMIEFVFGVYNPPGVPATIDHIGFKSVNTGKARIYGIDLSFSGHGSIGRMALHYFAGYTYVNPLDLSDDTTITEKGEDQVLKYRYKHTAKGDVSLHFMKADLGITMQYRSFMQRIDEAFEEPILGQYFFPGLKDYRNQNNKGSVVINMRVGWQVSTASKISLHVNNLFNKEYMGRPGDLQPPRSISLQYVLKIN
ncbi:MAG TPA: TonB-dependent receptor, partial [Bacteroidales bacterium]|nr:TonB-dependent receptor [Bacteroidales bacterium]